MAQKFSMDDTFKRSYKSIDLAFKISAKRMGLEQDEDLNLYATLQPNDFAELTKLYGENEVLNYIKTMEKQRLLGK